MNKDKWLEHDNKRIRCPDCKVLYWRKHKCIKKKPEAVIN